MDDVMKSLPYVERKGIRLRKRNVYDRARYLRGMRDEEKARLVEDLKAAGITGKDALAELRRFESIPWGSSQAWVAFVLTPDGVAKVIEESAEDENPGQGKRIAAEMIFADDDDRTSLILDLCSISYRQDDDADPTQPAGPATTTTGNPTDT